MLLQKAIDSLLGNLPTLNIPLSEIQAKLPSFQVQELQHLLDQEETPKHQQPEGIEADDITKLAAHQTDLEVLFYQHLAKHQRLTSLIEENLAGQEEIIAAMKEVNARNSDSRHSTADIQQLRASAVAAFLSCAEAYPDLMDQCLKGLEFYREMDTYVTELLQRLRSQQEEGEQAARTRIAGDNSYSPSLSAGFPPSRSIIHNDFPTKKPSTFSAGQLF